MRFDMASMPGAFKASAASSPASWKAAERHGLARQRAGQKPIYGET